MKKVLLQLSILFLLFGFNYSVYSQPTPLVESDFPKTEDSIRFRTNIISPVTTFKDTVKKNDSLSIDRSLYKALEGLGDDDMKNLATNKGANKTWNIVTFYYNNLPGGKTGYRTYRTPNAYVSGASSFPSSNLYYALAITTSGGTTNNNVFLKKDATGIYELGTRVMQSPPYNLTNSIPKPILRFPLDYNSPNNVDNISLTTSGGGADSKTLLDVSVDAWGTLNVVTGSATSPKTKTYENCLRTVTHSIDTMTMEPFHFFIESKIYNWFAAGTPEAIATFSYAKVRNDVDPAYWSLDPLLVWHDECDMSYITFSGKVTDAIDENSDLNDFINVFPNPSNGTFNVMIDKALNNFKNIEVSDMLGNVIYSKEISGTENGMILVNLSDKSKGLYLLKINSDDSSVTRKIFIK